MSKFHWLFIFSMWTVLPSISHGESNSQWSKLPFSASYGISLKNLPKHWDYFHRATDYPFPDAAFITQLLSKNTQLQSAIPNFVSEQDTSEKLQRAWLLFFNGDFQGAAIKGYELGPIGHGVAFYSQVTYASRLEASLAKRHELWEDVLDRHEQFLNLTGYDAMTRFFAFFARARLSEEISSPEVVLRGLVSDMQKELSELNALEPGNVFALAARASMDAGIVRKLGSTVGRITYGADSSVVKEFYDKALAKNKLIPNVHLEYAQSLLYIEGKDALPEALKHMEIASNITPRYAMEELDVRHAKKLLNELIDIHSKGGYGLKDYVRRNTDKEKKYYF